MNKLSLIIGACLMMLSSMSFGYYCDQEAEGAVVGAVDGAVTGAIVGGIVDGSDGAKTGA
ncbi:hypothetical protein [Vibrio variabilis]|nr:hypothetical protein [Vibrio variabilis]